MSIPVALDEIPTRIDEYGDTAYLVTSGPDHPHLLHVVVTADEGSLICAVGGSPSANVDARPTVVLLWPALHEGGYSMLIDGLATVEESAGERRLRINPTRGMLHRPARKETTP